MKVFWPCLATVLASSSKIWAIFSQSSGHMHKIKIKPITIATQATYSLIFEKVGLVFTQVGSVLTHEH